jgi:hypothetical protein
MPANNSNEAARTVVLIVVMFPRFSRGVAAVRSLCVLLLSDRVPAEQNGNSSID